MSRSVEVARGAKVWPRSSCFPAAGKARTRGKTNSVRQLSQTIFPRLNSERRPSRSSPVSDARTSTAASKTSEPCNFLWQPMFPATSEIRSNDIFALPSERQPLQPTRHQIPSDQQFFSFFFFFFIGCLRSRAPSKVISDHAKNDQWHRTYF